MSEHGDSAFFEAMRHALCVLLVAAACSDSAPEASEERRAPAAKTPAAAPQQKAGATPAAAPAAADAERKRMLAGDWCLKARVDKKTNESSPDGSMWTFSPEGAFRYDGETPVSGEWKLDKDRLSLGEAGDYDVVSTSEEQMVLRRSGTDYQYARECGAELDRARRVTKLRRAAGKGDTPVTKALLDSGVDVNAVDELDTWKRTALLAAVEHDREETVSYLLARGANVAVANSTDKTPFDLARTKPAILSLLVKRLPVPKALKTPALVAPSAEGGCPEEHLKLHGACVHVYALPRPQLRAEIEAFSGGGESPRLGSFRPEQEMRPIEHTEGDEKKGKKNEGQDPGEDERGEQAQGEHEEGEATGEQGAAPAEEGIALDRSKLDPAALMNPDDPFLSGKQAKGKGAAFDAAEFKKEWCRASKEAIEAAQAGNNKKYADMLGLSKQAHAERLEKKYHAECE